MTEKITIESKTEGYIITKENDQYAVSSTDMMVRRVKALFGVTDVSRPKPKMVQKGQDTPREPPGYYQKKYDYIKASIEKKLAVPVAKPGITRGKVWNMLDDGYSISEIAEKLGLTEAAISYHEKSYVPKDVQDEIEDPDADFRPMLIGVIDTSTNYDSKLDGVE